MQETWIQHLDLEDPLEKRTATHPSILAWKITWMEETVGLESMGSQRLGDDRETNTFTFFIVDLPYYMFQMYNIVVLFHF